MSVDNHPVIIGKNITKRFGDAYALRGVSFSLHTGKMVGLIGPNGAGKTTLVNIILGFDTDYEGTITLADGIRVAHIPQFHQRDAHPMPLSVWEFFRIAAASLYAPHASRGQKEILATIKHTGLKKEHLSQEFHSLSGGERQRVLIARALLINPTLLVLDEPLASVDYPARESLYALLRHLNQKHRITILLVSHDVESIIPICDEVLCLNKTMRTGCHPVEFVAGEKTVKRKTIQHEEIQI